MKSSADVRRPKSRKLLPFSLMCLQLCYSLHMALNDVEGERVYHVWDILPEFLGHNFVSGLGTLKPKKSKKNLQPKDFFSKPRFFSAMARTDMVVRRYFRALQLFRRSVYGWSVHSTGVFATRLSATRYQTSRGLRTGRRWSRMTSSMTARRREPTRWSSAHWSSKCRITWTTATIRLSPVTHMEPVTRPYPPCFCRRPVCNPNMPFIQSGPEKYCTKFNAPSFCNRLQ